MREKLMTLTVAELKELAKSQGMKSASGKRKAELVEWLASRWEEEVKRKEEERAAKQAAAEEPPGSRAGRCEQNRPEAAARDTSQPAGRPQIIPEKTEQKPDRREGGSAEGGVMEHSSARHLPGAAPRRTPPGSTESQENPAPAAEARSGDADKSSAARRRSRERQARPQPPSASADRFPRSRRSVFPRNFRASRTRDRRPPASWSCIPMATVSSAPGIISTGRTMSTFPSPRSAVSACGPGIWSPGSAEPAVSGTRMRDSSM